MAWANPHSPQVILETVDKIDKKKKKKLSFEGDLAVIASNR
jgi:hypothetical protein